MNKFFLILLSVIITGSFSNNENKDTNETVRNKKEAPQKHMLLGAFERSELEQKPFSNWFNPGYEAYKPNPDVLKNIKEHISGYEITVLMGTWCGDSRREIPRLYKILDETGYDASKLKTIAVDRSKSTPEHIEEDLQVSMVPSIIFYKNDREINRFVEFSLETFEEDIAKIVSDQEYKNPYSE